MRKLAATILKRLALMLLVVLGVTIITFVISHVIPADPVLALAGPRATAKTVATLRHQLALDQPLYVQYLSYLSGLLHGDLGTSIQTRAPVASEIFGYMPATAELMLTAFLMSLVIGIPLGVATALDRDGPLDLIGRGVAILGISTPSFWMGLLLVLLFYQVLGWLPGAGRLDVGLDPPTHLTGFYLIDGTLTGNWLVVRSAFNHLLLPAVTLAVGSIGLVVRIIRASMIEELSKDYIRTARAYGLSRRRVVLRYALPNALLPFVTVLGLEFASLLFGSVVIESVFAWPGVGSYVLGAILGLDFPVIMGFTVLASIVYILANLAVDVAYLMLDPRQRQTT